MDKSLDDPKQYDELRDEVIRRMANTPPAPKEPKPKKPEKRRGSKAATPKSA